MQLILHGVLAERYGRTFDMKCSSVADAVNGIARQVDDWPRDMRVVAVGFDTPGKLLGDTDEKVVHIMPALAGGGGKYGGIILGAVTFAVGFAMVFTGFGAHIGISLMVSGAMMMVQGVIQLFLKSPELNKNDNEGSKYLPVNRNTIAVGTPITMAWGTIDLAGHWLSLQSDSSNLSHGVFPA
jgi:predicted phage tail protein